MQQSEAIEIIARLTAIWPRPNITEATINEYVESILDLSKDQVRVALERLRVTATFLPSIAELRQAALDADLGTRLPDADQAWLEVKSEIRRVGSKRGMLNFATNEPWELTFSNPAIEAAVVSMGWDELCGSDNEVADRAHFMKLYAGAVHRTRSESGLTPAAKELAASMVGVFALPDSD